MLKIMIVENDAMIADYLEDVLNDAGYEVCGIAPDVESAIALGRACQPDLGIIDLRLSDGRFGTEVAAALCPGNAFGALYSTGNPDHPVLQGAMGVACLSKPYTPDALVAALTLVRARMMGEATPASLPNGFRLLH
ncbi:response regulator [Falsiroseomonas stagni]|uniref:Response regulator receiver domain-containing protein n=1 Tax=Falsiroseomonas stagni DSM 19981 TaxID=1123062 RepID=A0A1I4EMV5_9PROT|nr:response regulator [Falsiroseomonas stagni]SFL06523.1 Response regulator receiver domain-containing protein [Falsiroseomonas stagni DSM 19981]